MTVGERIRFLRKEKGMSQLDLARKMGFETKGALSMIESGKRDMSLEKFCMIVKALETTPNILLGWYDEDQASQDALQ